MIPTRARSKKPEPRKSAHGQFRADVLRGLHAPAKELPSKYFYDQAGSELFERITALDEYYLTRTEMDIMQRHATEMAGLLGRRSLLIEYGSGSSSKTRLLLKHLPEPAGFVPIDISGDFLRESARVLAEDYPQLHVMPLCADFSFPLELPVPPKLPIRRVVYFPGSTIGNFGPVDALALLRRTAELCGLGGGLLLGADLRKDVRVLEAAYNDSQGVTAAFNRNILVRINRELGADFDPWQFDHQAFYNDREGRIEMHLVSRRQRWAHVGGEKFSFAPGESIRTEHSYKFELSELHDLAKAAGFNLARAWTDARNYFSVNYFTLPG